jgi:multiple sugar transport system ATP-binding protein
MGVRPEDIYDKVYYMGDAKGRTMKTVVDVVEPMGAEKYLYLSSGGGQSMVARVNADNQAHVKQNIDVVVKLENAKFFDSETDAIIQ